MANILPVSGMLNPLPDFNQTWRQGVQFGQQQKERSESRDRERQVRNLAPQIVGGDPQAYAQAAAIDPQAAEQFQGAGDAQLRRFKGFVGYIDKAREQAQQTGDWRYVNAALGEASPYLSQLLGKPGPTEWPQVQGPDGKMTSDPQWEAGWEGLKARLAGVEGGGQQRNMVVSPGSAVVDPATGNVVYERPFSPANGSIVKVPDGQGGTVDMVWDPRTRQLSDLPVPGQGGPAPTAPPPPGLYNTPNGQVRIDAELSPEQWQAVQLDNSGGGASDAYNLPERDLSPSQYYGTQPTQQPAPQPQGGALPPRDVSPSQSRGGGLGYTPPKQPNALEAERVRLAQEASRRADEAAERARLGTAPAGQRFRPDGTLEDIPGAKSGAQSMDQQKAEFAYRAMAEDAYGFTAAFLGKPIDEVRQMTPEEIRAAIRRGRVSSGPVVGSLPFADKLLNPDLAAYSGAAAGKQARVNNPTGPVTDADFKIAAKSVFSPDKPADVNADLVYTALSRAAALDQLAPQQGGGASGSAPQPGQVEDGYRFRGGNPADPNSWERI